MIYTIKIILILSTLFSQSVFAVEKNDIIEFGAGKPVQFKAVSIPDNGYLYFNFSQGNDLISWNFTITRTGNSRNLLWKKKFGAGHDITLTATATTGSGDYLFTGYANSFLLGKNDIYILKVSHDGKIIFENTYRRDGIEVPNGVIEKPDKSLLVYGYSTTDEKDGAALTTDFYILTVDSAGHEKGTAAFGLNNINENCLAAAVLENSSVILAGTRNIVSDYLYFMKISTEGVIEWEQIQKSDQQIIDMNLISSSRQHITLTGLISAHPPENPLYTLHFSENGRIMDFQTIEQPVIAANSKNAQNPTKEAVINRPNVRMRSEPNLDSEVIELLEEGITVNIIQSSSVREQIGNWNDFWYKIILPNQVAGWVYGSFINLIPEE